MRRLVAIGLLMAIVVAAAGAGVVLAENNAASSDATSRLNASSSANGAQNSALDQEARQPGGDARVQQRLASQFGVQKSTIDQLRAKNMGYDDISQLLQITAQMPGGATSDNVNRVAALHGQRVAWPQIAEQMNAQGTADASATGAVPSNDISRASGTTGTAIPSGAALGGTSSSTLRSGVGTSSGLGTGASSGTGTSSSLGIGATSGTGSRSSLGTGAASGSGTSSSLGTGASSGTGTSSSLSGSSTGAQSGTGSSGTGSSTSGGSTGM